MTLHSRAQSNIILVDPRAGSALTHSPPFIEVIDGSSSEHNSHEHDGHKHEHGHDSNEESKPNLFDIFEDIKGAREALKDDSDDSDEIEVSDSDDELMVDENDLKFGDLPGAPQGTIAPEPIVEQAQPEQDPLQVSEEDLLEAKDKDKPKKNEKWDWESKGPHGFVAWIKDRFDSVPTHSGYDSSGLERAISYLDKLDNEISKAMRLDLDGELDADKIEKVRSEIDEGISRLQERIDKVKTNKKSKRKKKSEVISDAIIKEGQKITGVQGVYVVVPLLISRIARVCINGTVSGGHDIEDIYENQIKKYNLDDREQAEVMQLLSDMGYAMRQDRGYTSEDDIVVEDGKFDWSSQYNA